MTDETVSLVNGHGTVPGRADCPGYDRDAVPLGPFMVGPSDLYGHLHAGPDGETLRSVDLRDCTRQWLIGALDAANVTLGAEDMLVITELAEQGTDVAQVVAGWIARANQIAVRRG